MYLRVWLYVCALYCMSCCHYGVIKHNKTIIIIRPWFFSERWKIDVHIFPFERKAKITWDRQAVGSSESSSSEVRSFRSELSMGWVDPWVWLGLVGLGRDFSDFGGLGLVGSIIAKVLKIWKDYVNAFKTRSVKNMNELMLGWLKLRDKFCV